MTSAKAIRSRPHAPRPKPLSAAERKHIANLSANPRLPEEIERRRLGLAVTPAPVSARNLIKTLMTLADRLEKAGESLETLPKSARALLQQEDIPTGALLGGT